MPPTSGAFASMSLSACQGRRAGWASQRGIKSVQVLRRSRATVHGVIRVSSKEIEVINKDDKPKCIRVNLFVSELDVELYALLSARLQHVRPFARAEAIRRLLTMALKLQQDQ